MIIMMMTAMTIITMIKVVRLDPFPPVYEAFVLVHLGEIWVFWKDKKSASTIHHVHRDAYTTPLIGLWRPKSGPSKTSLMQGQVVVIYSFLHLCLSRSWR